MKVISNEKEYQIYRALDQIYQALCAEDMDGAFRANYILRQINTVGNTLDPHRKRLKWYNKRKRKRTLE